MSEEFKAIETQEEFDKAIKARLERNTREVKEKFKDYLSPDDVSALKSEYDEKIKALKESAAGNDQVVKELTQRAKAAETSLMKNRIANEKGIPLELAERLVGDNEEEVKKDAESFASFIAPKTAPPLATGETPKGGSGIDAGYASLLANLNQTLNQ